MGLNPLTSILINKHSERERETQRNKERETTKERAKDRGRTGVMQPQGTQGTQGTLSHQKQGKAGKDCILGLGEGVWPC